MLQLTAQALLLLGGLAALYLGAEWLVRGSARLAASMGIHAIVVGLTVVSMGTSAPELVVSLIAALGGNPDIAVGNVMGSNLANVGLILGITALLSPLEVNARVVHREVPLMLLITLALYPLAWDGGLGRFDGLALVLMLAFYLIFVFKASVRETPSILIEAQDFLDAEKLASRRAQLRDVGLVLLGCTSLVMGGTAIVRSAVFLATAMGIGQMTIGLSVVAVGTSLPELATTLVAATRHDADIAVGNVIGSNIFNVAAILGITSSVVPIPVAASVLWQELPAVLLLSIAVWPLTRSGWRIDRWEGIVLLCLYFLLVVWLVQSPGA